MLSDFFDGYSSSFWIMIVEPIAILEFKNVLLNLFNICNWLCRMIIFIRVFYEVFMLFFHVQVFT